MFTKETGMGWDAATEAAIKALHDSSWKLFLIATGAGAGLQQMLWSVAGTSRTMIDGAFFPYNSTRLNALLTREPQSTCNRSTAEQMATFAYVQVRTFLRSEGQDERAAMGFGLTAAVETDRERKGSDRVHIAVRTQHRMWCVDATLQKVGVERRQQGEICDFLGLNTILAVTGLSQAPIPRPDLISSEQLIDMGGRMVVLPDERMIASI